MQPKGSTRFKAVMLKCVCVSLELQTKRGQIFFCSIVDADRDLTNPPLPCVPRISAPPHLPSQPLPLSALSHLPS